MFDDIPVKRADVARLVAATFPDYKGRRITLRPSTSVTIHDLNWSGGTRNQYRTCTIEGRPVGTSARYNQIAPWENPAEGVNLPIPPGFAVVCSGQFQGRPTPLRIYVHPGDLAALIPTEQAA
jgi:hypothetical protein